MTFPISDRPFLPPNTIVPTNEDLFVSYLNRLYEDIAFAVNNKDPIQFPMAVTSVAQNILNLPNFGAFIICVSGVDAERDINRVAIGWLPTITASLVKSDAGVAGVINVLGTQAGTGTWAGINLTITATATNFQIAHNRALVTGNFNIRIIGTQS